MHNSLETWLLLPSDPYKFIVHALRKSGFADAEVNGGTAIEALERVVKKRWRRTSGKDWGNLYQDLCESIGEILLMVQKSGDHQLRLVVYPRYLHSFIHPTWCRISSINSMVICT